MPGQITHVNPQDYCRRKAVKFRNLGALFPACEEPDRVGVDDMDARQSLHTSTSSSWFYNTAEKFDDVPASSIPGFSSPESSCMSSPELFTRRLHLLLQAVLDRQGTAPSDNHSESDSGAEREGSKSPEKYDDLSTYSDSCDRSGSPSTLLHRDSDSVSAGVWAGTADDNLAPPYDDFLETKHTCQNKRKRAHLSSHTTNLKSLDMLVPYLSPSPRPTKKSHLDYNNRRPYPCRQSVKTADSSKSSPERKSLLIIHPPTGLSCRRPTKRDIAESRIYALLKREDMYRIQDGLPDCSFSLDHSSSEVSDGMFGIEPSFRRQIVQWIFDVLPSHSFCNEELYQHLICSEETRFHAMHLFTRYLLRVSEYSEEENARIRDARKELTWEAAFSCLAISTKFYHDFLHPLYPISMKEFMIISPHKLNSSQFERMQRDILAVFDYEIHGITPHAFFEELWDALPSLQAILDFRRPRRIVRNEMWTLLQRASLRWDMIRFPISVLTAAALIEGIVLALVNKYQDDDSDQTTESSPSQSDCESSASDTSLRRAREDVKPICLDLAEALHIPMKDLKTCRRWMALD